MDDQSDPALNTMMLHEYLSRWQAGDRDAANELVKACERRLDRLARHMLRSFPNVREWTEAEDVLQSSLMRLLHTLMTITPKSMRDYYNLAAVHIRRELLDLARRYRGRGYVPIDSDSGTDSQSGYSHIPHPASPPIPDDFDLWVKFHESIDELDSEEREVIGLVFYHGWTQKQIAELFQVDERTIRRRWTAACDKLRKRVDSISGNRASA